MKIAKDIGIFLALIPLVYLIFMAYDWITLKPIMWMSDWHLLTIILVCLFGLFAFIKYVAAFVALAITLVVNIIEMDVLRRIAKWLIVVVVLMRIFIIIVGSYNMLDLGTTKQLIFFLVICASSLSVAFYISLGLIQNPKE